jgi:hypothetical protein
VTRSKSENELDTEEGQTEMSRIPDSMTIEPNPDGQAEFNRIPNNVSKVSEAEAIVIEAPVAPVELVVASDNPLTDDIVNKDAKPQKAVRAHVTIVYVGDADTFSYGPYKFRPGQPAIMPSVIAEELLTYPFEKFEVKE